MAPVISLVTCTHNPSAGLFGRTLAAIAALTPPTGVDMEYVIVDNASDPPLAARAAEFPALRSMPWARIAEERTPGLSSARRRAIGETRGDLIVWFDDDLVPAAGYVVNTLGTAVAHPDVSVFGAGTIRVEFTDPVPAWVEAGMRGFFQERRTSGAQFGTPRQWAHYCPFGSGLVTRRAAAQRWSDAIERGTYTLSGRSGGRLSSGDDAQMIFSAVSAGERIGVNRTLELTHLIPGRRCTEDYIARMEYGLSAGLRIALAECFPNESPSSDGDADRTGFVDTLRDAIAIARAHGLRQARFGLARQLGALAGGVQVAKRAEPVWLGALRVVAGVGD